VIPADRKWFARIASAAVLVQALIELDPRFPVVTDARREVLREAKQALEAQAPKGAAPDPFEHERGDGKVGTAGSG
jgi:antitoxin component HigA of HigAB toxin-antitoxin module